MGMSSPRTFAGYGLAAALLLLSGCQTFKTQDGSWRTALPWGAKSPLPMEIGTAERMAVIWKDSSMETESGVTRGFGGRLYFYDAKGQPICVDGELTVYAFDDSQESKKTSPDRVYKFKPEELPAHHSKTQLGDSYSIWIPWDAAGGPRKTISLIPVFKSKENKIVRADHTLNVLPGKAATPDEMPASPVRVLGSSPAVIPQRVDAGVPLQASALQANALQQAREERKMEATTITVPRTMADRIQVTDVTDLGGERALASGPNTTAATGGAQSGPVRTVSAEEPAASEPASLPNRRAVFGSPGAYK